MHSVEIWQSTNPESQECRFGISGRKLANAVRHASTELAFCGFAVVSFTADRKPRRSNNRSRNVD
jgi:hypothetical protein